MSRASGTIPALIAVLACSPQAGQWFIGRQTASIKATAPKNDAVNGTKRCRSTNIDRIANAPMPQLRNKSDSNMFEAGIRPAICHLSDRP